MKENIKELLKESQNVHKEIINDANSSEVRWQNKKVKSFKNVYIPTKDNFGDVIKPTTGILSLSDQLLLDNNKTLEVKASAYNKDQYTRPSCAITINFPKVRLDKFNRVSVWINIKATGFQNFYYHFKLGNKGVVHTASIVPNKWTRVMWELDLKMEDEVDKILISPFLFGCPPEAESDVSFFVGKVALEEVDPDYVFGWDLEKRIAYCHSGYFINSKKVALTGEVSDKTFYIIDEANEVVYKNQVKLEITDLGKYYVMDFSEFTKEGFYKLAIDERTTNLFEISENPYMTSILKSMNFLRLLRCGEEVEGVHSACHLNCKTVKYDGSSVPNFGGWHDAGDVSQFEIPTAEMASAILDLANKTEEKVIKERLLEEAKVGINWLLRTRFSDGYRALAVSYNIWRKNELAKDDDSVLHSVAEIGPFESFLSSSALAIASRSYTDPIFTSWCKRVAIDDFKLAVNWYKEGIHTKRWGENIDATVAGAGLLAAAELYLVTNDENYISKAIEYSKIVMACQETNYLKESNIRGFFYEDTAHKYVLAFEHRGHEQSPIQGLCRILQVYPEINNREDIINSLNLYKEFILSTIKYTSPYNLLPGNIYHLDKLNPEHFTIPTWMCSTEDGILDMQNQIKAGIKINDEGWYLRIFPVAVQRRGFHATLLSKTKGLSLIYNTLKDASLRQIIIDQLEWILGKNPFASSTMYGEGYNYHPLYVAYSRQMVGALPVGIKTKGDQDIPYWPTSNNAVFKEIWGHTTGKYLWVLADLL